MPQRGGQGPEVNSFNSVSAFVDVPLQKVAGGTSSAGPNRFGVRIGLRIGPQLVAGLNSLIKAEEKRGEKGGQETAIKHGGKWIILNGEKQTFCQMTAWPSEPLDAQH